MLINEKIDKLYFNNATLGGCMGRNEIKHHKCAMNLNSVNMTLSDQSIMSYDMVNVGSDMGYLQVVCKSNPGWVRSLVSFVSSRTSFYLNVLIALLQGRELKGFDKSMTGMVRM